ncbi:peptidylprolyl isomerase [Stenomitos frigidus]|uniref:peptidylprolyl isomerase n=1 Tax=Stenomitos frigidus ULC18 TaxID=2107698 RepID=A0A2T1DTB7_9CYAN|nr:peptidylprolyl isomerase [Stenomitos frigidus]PSB23737.1 peptidylprolyl isomerase [Stenomitos frigidus ULC18]
MIDVSGIVIEIDEIVLSLKKEILLKDVCHKILRQHIVDEAAQARNITITPEDIQVEADRLRHEYHLQKASDTLAWLEEQLVTMEDWEAGIRDRLLLQKLTECLFNQNVESFFAQNRLDFERALVYQIIVPYAQLAQEIFYEIEEEEISFYEAAHLYDVDPKRRYGCGYEGELYRWSLKPDISALVFGADPKKVIAPVQTEQGYHLLMVEEFLSAELTPELHQEILQKLFKEWLDAEFNHFLHNQPPSIIEDEATGL